MRILAVPGSLRPAAISRGLVLALGENLPEGVELVEWTELDRLPAYAEHVDDGRHDAVATLRDALASADGVVFVTPEYNGSVPGSLKNAVDWASRPFGTSALAGLPAAVISHSPSPFGGTWAAQDLRRILGIAGARVLEDGVSVGRSGDKVTADGLVLDAGVADDLAGVLVALRGAVEEVGAAA